MYTISMQPPGFPDFPSPVAVNRMKATRAPKEARNMAQRHPTLENAVSVRRLRCLCLGRIKVVEHVGQTRSVRLVG